VWDSPDGILWKEATDKEYFILEDKRKCWIKIKIKDIPRGKSLIDVRWLFKLKYKNGVFEKHRARIVAKGYLSLSLKVVYYQILDHKNPQNFIL
jgi:hypothetical protein